MSDESVTAAIRVLQLHGLYGVEEPLSPLLVLLIESATKIAAARSPGAEARNKGFTVSSGAFHDGTYAVETARRIMEEALTMQKNGKFE